MNIQYLINFHPYVTSATVSSLLITSLWNSCIVVNLDNVNIYYPFLLNTLPCERELGSVRLPDGAPGS